MDKTQETFMKVLTAAGNVVKTQLKEQLNIDADSVVIASDGKVGPGGKDATVGFILFWEIDGEEKSLRFELPSYLVKDSPFVLCPDCLETKSIENKGW